MIKSYTRLQVADNTGAREILCIRVVGPAKADSGKIGDTIIGSVKTATANGQVKKKEVVRAVIIRQKFPLSRQDGTVIRFDDNAAVLINPDKTPRGTRIFGPVAKELREKGFPKIVSLATEVI